MNYLILKDTYTSRLEEAVNRYKSMGYSLHGNLIVFKEDGLITYVQVVVKE